jgi:shikimate kinase
MGTGKTEVSKILAQRLERQRLCIDDMIEWKVGKPISRIFQEDGEAFFRKVEAKIIAAASKDKNVVIDAGGGVVINRHNVKRLKEHGVLFCLTARPEIIFVRTKNNTNRPLLDTEDHVAAINKLLEERAEYYKRAEYFIDTSSITPRQAADRILEILQQKEAENNAHLILT